MLFGAITILIVLLLNLYLLFSLRLYYAYMLDRECIVCQEFPALHKVTITQGDTMTTHYLCTAHFQEIQDTRKFFSMLDTVPVPHHEFYDISEFMMD